MAHIVTPRGRKEPALLSAHPNWPWKVQSGLLFGSRHFIHPPKWDGTDPERQRILLANKPSLYMNVTQAFGFWTQTYSKQRQRLWPTQENKYMRIGMLVWKLSSMVNIPSLDEMGCVPLEEGIHTWEHESLSTLFMRLQIHQISLRSRKMRVTFSTTRLIWPGQRPVPLILHSF